MLILIGIIPAAVATRSVVREYEDRAVSLRIMNVRNQCEILRNQLLEADYFHNTSSLVVNSQLSLLSNVYFGRIMVIDKSFRVIRDTFDLGVGRINVSEQVIQCFRTGSGSSQYDRDNHYIVLTVPVGEEDGKITGVILVSVSTNEITQNVRSLEKRSGNIILISSIFVLLVGYLIARYLVRPIEQVTSAIEDISGGLENETISVTNYTETKQITEAFNHLLGQVKAQEETRQQFVSNVSHELKTPLASMKVLADSLLMQEEVPNEIYREFMQDITKEIDRENGIITDLLEMVRMDRTAANLHVKPVDIGKMLETIIARLRPIAAQRNIELVLDVFRQVTAEVDESKLSLAFTNLIENGVKYNVDDGWVRISLNADHRYFYVTVADSGVGIAEEDQEFIFDRFYRTDKSHSTEIEGTGLGLSIAKSAITLHNGVIRVTSKIGEGTSFQTRIPLAAVREGEE